MQDIATEIVELTARNIAAAVSIGTRQAGTGPGAERRSSARWQFDGVVEFRDSGDGEDFADGPEFGILGNISEGGLCMKCDRSVAVGNTLDLGVHTGASTLTGRGTVVGSHEAEKRWLVRVRFDV